MSKVEIFYNTKMRLYISLIFLSFSLFVKAEEIKYQLHWLSIPVAKLSLIYNRSLVSDDKVEFMLSTQGPLKLYRNYLSRGYINKKNEKSWDYYLTGIDRGQPEEKLISYSYDHEPEIKKFTDDTGVEPISIDSILDNGSIDPFSILIRTTQQLISNQECNKIFSVMDGKRRYQVKLSLIGKEFLRSKLLSSYEGEAYHCQMVVLDTRDKTINLERKKWPFNGSKKVIDMWFSENLNFQVVKFQVISPLGRITGRVVVH